jgi:hypothetical protein
MNNSGFNPKVVFPYGYATQTESNATQTPFYFGASAIPLDLGYTRGYKSTKMKGRGLTSQEMYDDLLEPSPSNAVLLLANNSKPIRHVGDRRRTDDEPISRDIATIVGAGMKKFREKQTYRVY